MARSWRDYASAEGCDKSDNSDESPFVPNVPNVTELPALVRDGLTALGNMAAPRLMNPSAWPGVVADAHRLASEGWALQAIRLGWSALDLFGAVPDQRGDPEADGLAAKLCGRPVLAICGTFATVRDGPSSRSFIHRGNKEGARLLWELGGGR